MEFKDKLKKIRLENDYTQAELAEKIYVSRSAVAKWENGLGLPSDASLEELCKVFNISKDELLSKEIENKLVDKNVKIYKLNTIKYSLLGLLAVALIVIITLSINLSNRNKNLNSYVAPKITLNDSDDYYAPEVIISNDHNSTKAFSTHLNKEIIANMQAIEKSDDYTISSNYSFMLISSEYYYIDDEYNYIPAENYALSFKSRGISNKLWYNASGYDLIIEDNSFILPECDYYFIVRFELLIENINYTYFFLIK